MANSDEKNSRLDNHISKIDSVERKKLFETFVSKGGQVIDHKPKKINKPIVRVRNKDSASSEKKFVDTRKPSQNLSVDRDRLNKKKILGASMETILKEKKRLQLKGFRAFLLRFNNFITGITIFSGRYIQSSFCAETYDILTKSVKDIQMISKFITDSVLFIRVDLLKSLSEIYPACPEIVLRFNNIDVKDIAEKFKNKQAYSIISCKRYYFAIIKQFFPFLGKQETVLNSYKRALTILRQMPDHDPALIDKEIIRITKAITSFYNYCAKLDKLYPLLIDIDAHILSKVSKEFLELTEGDFLGAWSERIQEQIARAEKNSNTINLDEEVENEVEESRVDPEKKSTIEQGLSYIYGLELDTKFLSPDITGYPRKDKIFIVMYLLDFCSVRYSILSNRNYFDYKTIQGNGERFSLELLLREFFLNIEKIHIGLKNYTSIISSLSALNPDWSHYTTETLSPEEDKLWKLKVKLSQQFHTHISAFINNFVAPITQRKDEFSSIIRNYDVLINPVLFGEQIFDSYIAIDIFNDFYQYILALQFLLNEGELAGTGSMISANTKLKIAHSSLD